MRFKSRYAVLMLIILAIIVAGCNGNENEEKSNTNTNPDKENKKTEEKTSKTYIIDEIELDERLASQALYSPNANFVVDKKNGKAYIIPVIKNTTGATITRLIVAAVAWDKNNYPILLYKEGENLQEGSYVLKFEIRNPKLGGRQDINDRGVAVDPKLNARLVKAIPIYYETSESGVWKNPCFEDFCKLYENQNYYEGMVTTVKAE